MWRSLLYLAIASASISLGVSRISKELRALDERDQDEAAALYLNFRGRAVMNKSQELKDKINGMSDFIKSRWRKTPQELMRDVYRRHGLFTPKLPGSI